MKKLYVSLTIYLFFLLAAINAWATPFTSLYVFGDSLSDGGGSDTAITSIYKLSGGNCDFAHPCPPYANGHYSNGQVAVEYLADKILPGGANPANFFSYAVGGATSGIGNYGDAGSAIGPGTLGLPGISAVINNYLTFSNGSADSNALYFIWGGANDLLTAGSPIDAALNIADNASKLIDAGATHLFIPNLPSLGLTPFAGATGMAEVAEAFSVAFNTALAAQLTALSTQFSGVDIIQFDTYSLFNHFVATPGNYGFTNAQNSCLTDSGLCTNPDEYIFWDALHPTMQTHKLLADAFTRALPSPGVPALLIIGSLAFIFSRLSRKNN